LQADAKREKKKIRRKIGKMVLGTPKTPETPEKKKKGRRALPHPGGKKNPVPTMQQTGKRPPASSKSYPWWKKPLAEGKGKKTQQLRRRRDYRNSNVFSGRTI